jgi:hypothetical protein
MIRIRITPSDFRLRNFVDDNLIKKLLKRNIKLFHVYRVVTVAYLQFMIVLNFEISKNYILMKIDKLLNFNANATLHNVQCTWLCECSTYNTQVGLPRGRLHLGFPSAC